MSASSAPESSSFVGSVRIFPDVPDDAAITEVIRGNREMFEVIVRRYNQPLYRIGMAYLRDPVRAEDAMQNAYVKAFFGLPRFRRGATFSTWLVRIMINECLMILRRRKAAPESLDLDPAGEERLPGEPAAPDHLHVNEMKILLEQAVATLPRNYRAVYVLREVQQLSVAETAACLGITAASVKVLLHRARERLKSAAGLELFSYRAVRCDPMTVRVMRLVLAAR